MSVDHAKTRRANLSVILEHLSSAAELNARLGRRREDPYIYAICSGAKLPSGRIRAPGPQLCEQIEDALELPRGWMTEEHADIVESTAPARRISKELQALLDGLLPAGDFEPYRVDGSDMSPALSPGDILLIDRTRTAPAAGIYLLEISGRRVIRRIATQLDGSLSIVADGMPGALALSSATILLGRAAYQISVKAL